MFCKKILEMYCKKTFTSKLKKSAFKYFVKGDSTCDHIAMNLDLALFNNLMPL